MLRQRLCLGAVQPPVVPQSRGGHAAAQQRPRDTATALERGARLRPWQSGRGLAHLTSAGGLDGVVRLRVPDGLQEAGGRMAASLSGAAWVQPAWGGENPTVRT